MRHRPCLPGRLKTNAHADQGRHRVDSRCGETPWIRLWLRYYPAGVPGEIDPSRYPSLVAMFEESFKNFSTQDACVCMGKTMSYRAVDEASRALAVWLQVRA